MNVETSLSGQTAPDTAKPPSPYLDYLDLFRGVAILFVVMIHSGNAVLLRGVSGLEEGYSSVRTLVHIASHDATVYFALISGILYAYRLHRKPHGPFLRSRVEFVWLPFALVSTGLTILFLAQDYLRTGLVPPATDAVGEIAFNVFMGEAWNTLWYIPVIMILYVISPVLLRIVTQKSLFVLALVLMILPLFISRTDTEVTPAMVTFFGGVYVVGLVIGRDPNASVEFFSRRKYEVAALALLAAAAIIFIDITGVGEFGPMIPRESAFYVLRLSLAALMLVALMKTSASMSQTTKGFLKKVAAYSFGIYFLHGPLLRPIAKLVGQFVPESNPAWALLLAVIAAFLIALAVSYLVVAVIKLVTGSYSKYVIGS
ncbi:acyltransferase [Qipengyuania xiapuensis]|uniref:Acyltransferase n=1 Tax=Qipengyuania xiapuensis TaxID=2867236 RepID=A0ABX8ZXB0_9SPHN|nr:acyltransferase [Qipengyuania xiapuensis]QZD92519.1 acyltransferase [Qipengyuania xiapuensis]